MHVLTLLLFTIMLVTFFTTFYFSHLYRHSQGSRRGVYRSWMNISMGLLFVALAAHLFSLPLTTWGRITNTLILAVGVINLYYGWKHRQYFQKQS